MAFAVDVGIAGDTPGVTSKKRKVKWVMDHKSFLYDASVIGHTGLRDFCS
ncbi:hypothetical protein AAHB49_10540 [Bacillus cereus]